MTLRERFILKRIYEEVGCIDHIDRANHDDKTITIKRVKEIIQEVINDCGEVCDIGKILFVEDGSVDIDALKERLSVSNPEILVVVYRQGGRMPQLTEV